MSIKTMQLAMKAIVCKRTVEAEVAKLKYLAKQYGADSIDNKQISNMIKLSVKSEIACMNIRSIVPDGDKMSWASIEYILTKHYPHLKWVKL